MTSVYCPEMHCFSTGVGYKQPNMGLFSLNEQDEWTLWRSNSDYFYPEMIPEPDYSDSGDDAGSEDDEYISTSRHSRPISERLRDVTEVYVANADVKIKKAALPKMPPNKQADSSKKEEPKSHVGEKVERQPRKMSPKTLPKEPRNARSKSPTKVSRPTPKTVKLQEGGKKPPMQKAKSSSSRTAARVKSPESTRKTPARPKSPTKANDSKSKPTAGRGKSPVGVKRVPTKTKSPTRGTSPSKAKPKAGVESQTSRIKATSTETKASAPKTKREVGDTSKTSPRSSPTTDESKSSISSAVSTEHSSDDDLIKPRKPYQFTTEKQKLHKELKFSQRYCKLASPKTELQLAIERFTENKEKRGLETGERTSLEKILDIQARKIKMQEATDTSAPWMDHLQRPQATLANSKTDEFYRVHARVVSNNSLTHCFLPDDDHTECLSSQTLTHTESGSDS